MNNQKEYLNENKYQSVKKVLITIGCISLVIGICLFISSFFVNVPKMGEEGWFEAKKTVSTLRFIAFPFGLMIPMFTFFMAFGRDITAYQVQQMRPVAQEGIEKMAPSAGVAAKEIAKGIKEGLKDDEE